MAASPSQQDTTPQPDSSPNSDEAPFPWHIPVYDAHCHPTDTPTSLPSIPDMRTRTLTVMSTRTQDQPLVASLAETHGITSPDASTWSREQRVVPCFGWHPWFAHLMYLDESNKKDDNDEDFKERKGGGEKREGNQDTELQGEAKLTQYLSVLTGHRPAESLPEIQSNPSHPFHSLPNPLSFTAFLAQTRAYLQAHPYALVGEIGLDRSFRIPDPSAPPASSSADDESQPTITPGTRQGRPLTPYHVSPAHQKALFQAQLRLAGEMQRAVSVHGVQAHGMVYEAVRELWVGCEREVVGKKERKKRREAAASSSTPTPAPTSASASASAKPFPPRLCLHSYSGNASNFKQYVQAAVPVEVFASFSTAINLGDKLDGETPRGFAETVQAVPDDRVLVESDLHVAGEEMDARMEDIVRRVCAVKGWGLEEGVRRLGRNWRRFVFGEETEAQKEG